MYLTTAARFFASEYNVGCVKPFEISYPCPIKKYDIYDHMESVNRCNKSILNLLSKNNSIAVEKFLDKVFENLNECVLLEKGGITSYVNNDTVHAVCLIHCSIFIKTLVALASIFSSKIRIYFPLSQQTRETKTIKINSLEIITLDLSAVGRHISVSEIKKNEIFSKPFQFFCMNPQSYNSSCFDESEIEKVKTKIKNFGFVHAPYIFNLAKKSSIEGSKKCLELSSKLNAKGVVFHCGKGDDILTFEYVIKELCKSSNQECPCILETPAGQGTEMLYKFSEFVSFCKKIENLKVCIDTCHVFASGYDPYEYILKSLTYLRDKIVLVHFNDSQYHCGSRLDRHAYPGHGYIGMETMLKVYELCLMYSIPMVIE